MHRFFACFGFSDSVVLSVELLIVDSKSRLIPILTRADCLTAIYITLVFALVERCTSQPGGQFLKFIPIRVSHVLASRFDTRSFGRVSSVLSSPES